MVLAMAGALSIGMGTARAADGDTLYADLGGQANLVRIVDDLVTRAVADPRIAPFFEKANLEHLRTQLVAQFCQVSGGGCAYEGPSMAVAHQDMDLRVAHFNALVEDLQRAMDDQGVPFGVQNRLLARLAPMHREIVATPQ
jgi:hemoglobin